MGKSKLITLLLLVVLLASCSEDKEEEIQYKGEHSLLLNDVQASGFGAIMATGTFNLVYDPSISEVGFILTDNRDNTETKKQIEIGSLESKETVVFNNLTDGVFSVKLYLINKKGNVIYSNSKNVSLLTNSEYSLSCLYDYINEDGKPVLSVKNKDFISISIYCKNPIATQKVYMKLSEKPFEMNFIESSSSWEDGNRHYYIDGYVSQNMPVGKNNIEIVFEDQTIINTGIVLNKLSGNWQQLNSLYTGVLGGVKVAFQKEQYGFLVQKGDDSPSNELQIWRMEFSSLRWKRMSSLVFPQRTHISEIFPTQITIGSKAYIIFTAYSEEYEWVDGNELYMGLEEFFGIWEYDMDSDVWSQKIKIKGELPSFPVVFAHNNKFFIVGGKYYDIENQIDIFSDQKWVYDAQTDSMEKSKFSGPIDMYDGVYYSTFESQNYTYIITSDYTNWKYKILRYSKKNNTWEEIKSPYPLISGQGIGYADKSLVYYIGGRVDYATTGVHPYCYTFSEDTNEWRQIVDFPSRISLGITFRFNSKIYVGIGAGDYESRVTMYTWEE